MLRNTDLLNREDVLIKIIKTLKDCCSKISALINIQHNSYPLAVNTMNLFPTALSFKDRLMNLTRAAAVDYKPATVSLFSRSDSNTAKLKPWNETTALQETLAVLNDCINQISKLFSIQDQSHEAFNSAKTLLSHAGYLKQWVETLEKDIKERAVVDHKAVSDENALPSFSNSTVNISQLLKVSLLQQSPVSLGYLFSENSEMTETFRNALNQIGNSRLPPQQTQPSQQPDDQRQQQNWSFRH